MTVPYFTSTLRECIDMMADIGGAILRAQTGRARESDIYAIIRRLLDDADFREARVGAVGQLTAEIPEFERQEICRAMAILLLADFKPPASMVVDRTEYHHTTPPFVRYCAPSPGGPWQEMGHIQAEYNSKAQAKYVQVSPYLRDLLRALEDMWNVGGHLLKEA